MKKIMLSVMTAIAFTACTGNKTASPEKAQSFSYEVDKFADLQILRYQVPGFESLTLNQKQLLYHLSQAAIMGRDILFDQNCRYNLAVRRTLEAITENYKGDRSSADYKAMEVYLKRVWFSNGIHHHYGEEKFVPGFSEEFFVSAVKGLDPNAVPVRDGQTVDQFLAELVPVIFDPSVLSKRTVQSGDQDLILASANNYYGGGITQHEVEAFYDKMKDPKDETPISYGLNSRLVKEDGKIVEKVWKVGGLYTQAIEKIVAELQLAVPFAENENQKKVIETLISYYKTGDLKEFDAYAVLWVKDTVSEVDFINGFTETYGDPLGMKASWESTVNFVNKEATKRTIVISNNAQWFEDNSPVDSRFKKKEVKGVSAKVITVAMLGGDCYPATPIGINLPNADWIRKDHGSKSVTIENITEAYDKASQGSGFNEEFVWSDKEREALKTYGFLTDNLHTDLHECLGHGSGQLLPGVASDALKAYSSTLEETRADLFGLYYIADPKLVELGLVPDAEAYKAEYYKFVMNGLMSQLVRIELGKNVEEAHMRNRQLIAKWAFEQGKADNVIELKKKEGKTYVVVNDYAKLRELFGKLLAEVQRIKSEGDFAAGKKLVEDYAVKVDPELHAEVLKRYAALNLAPYKGFVNPVMKLAKNEKGEVTDVTLDYTEGYTQQMMRYGKEYSFLPTYND
ncbi:dipeptidyl-peptidase 3 family protein [Macellibacteroides fermentans]|uniref:dipeptidyl-peptidase 3 family protein n=1 Tax=Macellibacteroides fermentans TaxID=879969 RepID=UPI00406D0694